MTLDYKGNWKVPSSLKLTGIRCSRTHHISKEESPISRQIPRCEGIISYEEGLLLNLR